MVLVLLFGDRGSEQIFFLQGARSTPMKGVLESPRTPFLQFLFCVCGCVCDCEVWELGRARSDGTGAVCGWRRAPSMGVGSAEEARNVGSGLWKPVEPQPSELETQKWGGWEKGGWVEEKARPLHWLVATACLWQRGCWAVGGVGWSKCWCWDCCWLLVSW